MPYGIESAGDGGDGVHESITQPNGEDGVFLAKGLGRADGTAALNPHPMAQPKLEDAADEGNEGNGAELREAFGAVDDAMGGDGYGDAEGYGPKVETEVTQGNKLAVEGWKQVAYELGEKKGADKHGENLGHNPQEGGEKGDFATTLKEGKAEGDDEGYGQVDEYGVHGNIGSIAVELLGYYGGSSSGRADETEHGAFDEDSSGKLRVEVEKESEEGEAEGLQQKHPKVATMWAHLFQVNL